jgi:hypothetical protein
MDAPICADPRSGAEISYTPNTPDSAVSGGDASHQSCEVNSPEEGAASGAPTDTVLMSLPADQAMSVAIGDTGEKGAIGLFRAPTLVGAQGLAPDSHIGQPGQPLHRPAWVKADLRYLETNSPEIMAAGFPGANNLDQAPVAEAAKLGLALYMLAQMLKAAKPNAGLGDGAAGDSMGLKESPPRSAAAKSKTPDAATKNAQGPKGSHFGRATTLAYGTLMTVGSALLYGHLKDSGYTEGESMGITAGATLGAHVAFSNVVLGQSLRTAFRPVLPALSLLGGVNIFVSPVIDALGIEAGSAKHFLAVGATDLAVYGGLMANGTTRAGLALSSGTGLVAPAEGTFLTRTVASRLGDGRAAQMLKYVTDRVYLARGATVAAEGATVAATTGELAAAGGMSALRLLFMVQVADLAVRGSELAAEHLEGMNATARMDLYVMNQLNYEQRGFVFGGVLGGLTKGTDAIMAGVSEGREKELHEAVASRRKELVDGIESRADLFDQVLLASLERHSTAHGLDSAAVQADMETFHTKSAKNFGEMRNGLLDADDPRGLTVVGRFTPRAVNVLGLYDEKGRIASRDQLIDYAITLTEKRHTEIDRTHREAMDLVGIRIIQTGPRIGDYEFKGADGHWHVRPATDPQRHYYADTIKARTYTPHRFSYAELARIDRACKDLWHRYRENMPKHFGVMRPKAGYYGPQVMGEMCQVVAREGEGRLARVTLRSHNELMGRIEEMTKAKADARASAVARGNDPDSVRVSFAKGKYGPLKEMPGKLWRRLAQIIKLEDLNAHLHRARGTHVSRPEYASR